MRTLSQLSGYLASADDDGVQLHQYATGTVRAAVAGDEVALRVVTEYPWDGRVDIEVLAGPDREWSLSVRVPAWADGATVEAAGEPVADVGARDRTLPCDGPGGPVTGCVVALPMDARLTAPHAARRRRARLPGDRAWTTGLLPRAGGPP